MTACRPIPVTTAAHFLQFTLILKVASIVVLYAFLGRVSDTNLNVLSVTLVTAQRKN